MNYYNPYFYTMPVSAPRVGLFSRLFGGSGITLSGILNGTQRALNFANQAIPLVKQVKPMLGNAKTMFKVMNEFKKAENPRNNVKKSNVNKMANIETTNEVSNDVQELNYSNGPTFFMNYTKFIFLLKLKHHRLIYKR